MPGLVVRETENILVTVKVAEPVGKIKDFYLCFESAIFDPFRNKTRPGAMGGRIGHPDIENIDNSGSDPHKFQFFISHQEMHDLGRYLIEKASGK
jgi:hypothetical protein